MANPLFISYAAPEDSSYVATLVARIEAELGLPAWYFERDEPAGVYYIQEIIRQINSCLAMLVVLTPTSVFSDAIAAEVFHAQRKGKPIIGVVIGPANQGQIDAGMTDGPIMVLLRLTNLIDARGGIDLLPKLRSTLAALGPPPAAPRLTVLLRDALDALPPVGPTAPYDLTGRSIRSYEVRRLVARTEGSVVYEAEEHAVRRTVALKAILPEYAASPAFRERFKAEAQRIAALAHPHIVPLYSFWADSSGAYLVMQWMAGGTLSTLIGGSPTPPGLVARIVGQVGQALIYAHRQGVIHLDLKPGNILRDGAGNAFLSDFGISRGRHEGVTAAMVGYTYGYASPEQYPEQQAKGAPITARADIYSLAVVVAELLIGARLFVGPQGYAQQLVGIPEGALARLPTPVAPVLLRALAPDYTARPPDMISFVSELQAALHAARGVATADNEDAGLAVTHIDAPNPYVGIAPFREQDAPLFFGRTAAVESLLELLAQPGPDTRALAVAGASGSGKSSLIRAGLIPSLRSGRLPGSERWRTCLLTPGRDPIASLAAALSAVARRPPAELGAELAADERGLLHAAAAAPPGGEVLLVIDQFEELFTLTSDLRVRRHVLASILAAVRASASRLRVVLTIRGDFYDRPLEEPEFGKLLLARTFWVEPLSEEELEDAIVQPARAVRVEVQRTLVREILGDMSGQPGMLPLLQYALSDLFERREGGPLSLQAYKASDGVRGALSRRAAEIYAGLTPGQQHLARQVFLRLLIPGEGVADTRRRVRLSELADLARRAHPPSATATTVPELASDADTAPGGEPSVGLNGAAPAPAIDPSDLELVLERFGEARARLLTFDREPGSQAPTVEVAHEALLDRQRGWRALGQWLDSARDDLRAQRRLAESAAEWAASGQRDDYLVAGARLAQYTALAESGTVALTGGEQAYLAASLAEQARRAQAEQDRQVEALAQAQRAERAQRVAADRLRAFAVALTVFLVIASGLGLFAFTQQQAAQRNLTRSEARRLAAEAQRLALADGEAPVIGLLAVRALGTEYTSEGDAALASAALLDYPVQQFDQGGSTLIDAVAFSSDGAYLLTGSEDGTAHLWDRRTGQEQRVFTHPGGALWGVAFSPDGAAVLTGGMEGAQLWDARTGAPLRLFELEDSGTETVAFSPDGTLLLVSSIRDKAALIFDVASGRELRRLTGHPAVIWRAVFSPDGRFVLSSGGDARLWETESGRLVHVLFGNTGDVQGVAFSPDGATIATGEGGTIRIWDAASGRELRRLVGHKPVVRSLAFTPDGRWLVSSSDDATVRVWDVASGEELRRLVGHTSIVLAIDISPDGRYVASGSLDTTALIWDLQASPVSPRMLAKDRVTGVAYTPDGRQVITTSFDGTATLWDVVTGAEIRSFTAPSLITVFALSPDGSYLLLGCADATIYALDIETGRELRRFVGQPTSVAAMAISPDGQYVVSGGVSDSDHYLWDAHTGALLRRLEGHTYENTFSTAFSPDSRFVVTGSYDYTARVWDVTTGQEMRRISFPEDGDAHGASSVAYSPDGTRILTGSWDGVMRLWDAESGALIRSYVGHSGVVFASAFSPDGRLMLTGSTDRTARLWEIETGVEVRRLAGHTGDVMNVAFAPGGATIVTGSSDGSIRLWDTDYQDTVAALCGRIIRDFTADERAEYGIFDQEPTCAGQQ